MPKRLLLITDAWAPQTNGVVTTLTRLQRELAARGTAVDVVHPGRFRTIPCPRYPEVRLALMPGRAVRRRLEERDYDAVHIATEGPLGLAARRWCGRRRVPFTTSFHTQFARYVRSYTGVPERMTYRALRWFHGKAQATLVPTPSMRAELEANGFSNLKLWTRGVDAALFRPAGRIHLDQKRPIFLYVGRVAREKNIEAFLELDLPGSKVVVGDGPMRAALEQRYPQVSFLGYRRGEALVKCYASADVFVFPSKTDTFGIVLIEALACGVPVAAYPVTGPVDIVEPGVTGVLSHDLRSAALGALALDRDVCSQAGHAFTWDRCAEIFLETLAPIDHRADPERAPDQVDVEIDLATSTT